MRYSTEPRNRIYIKEYGFLPFAKITGTHLSNKSGQNLLDSAKKPATDAKTTPKRAIQKTGEATGDLIVNKIADKITSVPKKYSVQYEKLNNDTFNDETEVPKKRYISPEEKQQIIDELRLVQQYNNGISKIANLLDNTLDQPSKFRTKNWVEINDESKESYGTGSDIKFKTTMLSLIYVIMLMHTYLLREQ